MNHKNKAFTRDNLFLFAVLCAIAILTSLPLIFNGIHYGHDLHFHLVRIEALAAEIQRGTFPIYIPKLWIDGYSYPASIYYGEWPLYIPAIFRILGMNLTDTYKLYILLNNFVLVFISYFSFSRILKKKTSAVLSTLLYASASYRFLDIYVRAAAGEYTAMAFLPLILLALVKIYTSGSLDKPKISRYSWIFAFGMSAVLTTHLLSFFMVCMLLVLFCVICFKKTFTKDVISTIGIAAAKTLALSAFFAVPLFDYLLSVKTYTGVTTRSEMALEGAHFNEFLGFFRSSYISGATDFNKTPGAALLLVMLLALIILYTEKTSIGYKILTGFCLLTLVFASKYFPWNMIAAKVPLGRIFVSIQFPWRWFEFCCILLALLGGFVVEYIPAKKLCNYAIVSLAIISTFMGIYNVYDYESKANLAQFNDVHDLDTRYVGAGEYLLAGTTDYFELNLDPTGSGLTAFNELNDSSLNDTYYCVAKSEGAWLEVPIFNYKGYVARTDSGELLPVTTGENNRIRIAVPKGFDGNITVSFRPPVIWILGLIITLLTLLFFLINYVRYFVRLSSNPFVRT